MVTDIFNNTIKEYKPTVKHDFEKNIDQKNIIPQRSPQKIFKALIKKKIYVQTSQNVNFKHCITSKER